MGPVFVTLRWMVVDEEHRSEDPRARAARTKRNRTRRALLDAAETTFSRRGWAGTRVEDVAAAAGVSPASAYNHFPTKHALVGHVFKPLITPLVGQAERDRAAGLPIVEALRDQVMALARLCHRHHGLTRAFVSAAQDYAARSGTNDPTDENDPRTLAPVPDCLRELVATGQRAGELRAYPAATEISGQVANLLLWRVMNRPTEPARETAELMLTVLFGALRPELLVEAGWNVRPFR